VLKISSFGGRNQGLPIGSRSPKSIGLWGGLTCLIRILPSGVGI
jgi:hypothetical protein